MTTSAEPDPVVIGADGSASSDRAVDAGVQVARRHGRPVRVVRAFEWAVLHLPLGPSPEGPPDAGLAADADRALTHARIRAVDAAQDTVPVTGEVVSGTAAAVLLAEARSAALVVIGDRGLGGLGGLLLGSVAVQLTAHSPAPVMVVRGRDDPQGPVVVGVEARADAATKYAFAEAAAAGADLVALTAWYRRRSGQPQARDAGDTGDEDEPPGTAGETDEVDRSQRRELASVLAPLRRQYPQVAVEERVVRSRPARALIEASATARLVVVGARGRGGFTGLLLGSVSRAVLQRADCPAVVVRTAPS